jgi:hypothetical protein
MGEFCACRIPAGLEVLRVVIAHIVFLNHAAVRCIAAKPSSTVIDKLVLADYITK